MRLVVLTVNGSSANLESVDPVAAVGDVKRQALAELSQGSTMRRSLSCYRLVHSGWVLEDDQASLAKFGIKDGTTLTLVTVPATVLAAGCLDGSLHILNPATNEDRSWKTFCNTIIGLAFNRDGSSLAVTGDFNNTVEGGQVVVFKVASGEMQGEQRMLTFRPGAISWSTEDSDIAVGDIEALYVVQADGKTRDVPLGHTLMASVKLGGGGGRLTSLSWQPQGLNIAVGYGGLNACGGVSVINGISGHVIWTWDAWRAVHAVEWSPDGTLLAVASGDMRYDSGAAHVLRNGVVEKCLKLDAMARSITWSPDGQSIALVTGQLDRSQGLLKVFTLGTDAESAWPCASGRSISWSPDGERLAASFDDRSVRVIAVANGEEVCRWELARVAQCVAWGAA